jgi:hypothetical protein
LLEGILQAFKDDVIRAQGSPLDAAALSPEPEAEKIPISIHAGAAAENFSKVLQKVSR